MAVGHGRTSSRHPREVAEGLLDATAIAPGHPPGRLAGGPEAGGGIRTLADATAYIEQTDAVMGAGWVTPSISFGASGLLTALLAALEGDTSVTSVEAY